MSEFATLAVIFILKGGRAHEDADRTFLAFCLRCTALMGSSCSSSALMAKGTANSTLPLAWLWMPMETSL